MGFHLRKSFNLGLFKLNFSNSGIGFSTGIKGLRFGIDGKGRNYIGGGVGPLRYREYEKNNKISTYHDENNYNSENYYFDKDIPKSLKSISKKLKIIYSILYIPIFLIFLLYGFGSLLLNGIAIKVFGLFCLFFAILPYYYMWFSQKSKNYNLLQKAIRENSSLNYNGALKYFLELKEFGKKLDYDSEIWLSANIIKLYEKIEDYENGLIFINNNSFIPQRRENIVKFYYKSKKWQDLINYIQSEYNDEEKEEHPIYYAMLGKAFLNSGQKEIALETMLQGPINKRNMSLEMCGYIHALGEVFEAIGENEKALKQYQKVYAFDCNYENVEEKIKKLSNQ